MLATLLQRHMAVTSNNWVETVVLVIAVIIGGSLLVWALTMAINNFLPEPFRGKATAVMYIIIAVLLAILVFHWAGLF